jgi:tRNA(fMet)-specific endonuclease VapC
MICLDTDAVIALLNKRSDRLRARLDGLHAAGETVAISTVVYFELWFGAAKSARRTLNAALIDGLAASPMTTLPLDYEDATEAGQIRAGLERRGTPIGAYDLLIAAQARRRDALLVTANLREFTRIEGLRVENWMS